MACAIVVSSAGKDREEKMNDIICQFGSYLELLFMFMVALGLSFLAFEMLASILQSYSKYSFYFSFIIIFTLNFFAAYNVFGG